MIRLFGKYFWSIYKTFIPGPEGSNPPVLILLFDEADEHDDPTR